MQKYNLPFIGLDKAHYDIKISVDGYAGEVTELVGARSPITITVEDDNFIYKPIRTSTAVINLKDKKIRTDLFSTNAQSIKVKLYREGILRWTGYIKAEQFTQPYIPNVASFSIDCVSAISTLEQIKYKKQKENGFITVNELLYYILSSANGDYDNIYIPHVYADSEEHYNNYDDIFQRITLLEENFISKEMDLLEVLENLMKFFSWTLWDCAGSIYIVDVDHEGEYLRYELKNGQLAYKEPAEINSVLLQDIGFQGANHTLDVLPGYNKVTVKSINNVFDQIIDEEDFEKDRGIGEYQAQDDEKRVYKKFIKPTEWKVITRDPSGREYEENAQLTRPNADAMSAILLRKSEYSVTTLDGEEFPNVSEYSWVNCVQMRSWHYQQGDVLNNAQYPAVIIKGVNAIWKNCAIAISFQVLASHDILHYDLTFLEAGKKERIYNMTFRLKIGDNYWNGSEWVTNESTFNVPFKGTEPSLSVINKKTPDKPYNGLTGYFIEFPTDRLLKGDFELTLYNYKDSFHTCGVIVTNLKIDYAKRNDVDFSGEDGDRIYKNIINEDNQSELDEVEYNIGSYNNDGSTYSKALLNDDFLTDNLYSKIENKLIRPEASFIRRACGRFENPQTKITQEVTAYTKLHPYTVLYDKSLVNKKFIPLSYTWEVQRNKLSLSMVENGNKTS